MCVLLKAACMPGIKKRITLPAEPVTVTESKILFTYCIDGKMRFKEVETGVEAAELLQQEGIICRFKGSGQHLKMYKHGLSEVEGLPPMFYEVEVQLSEIVFYPSDVIHIVANHEYELTEWIMGIAPKKPKAKIKHINTNTGFNLAA